MSLRDLPFLLVKCFLCFYLVFFISCTYFAQKLHDMNTPCTTIPPILCHFSLLYLLTCYYAIWVSSSKSSQPHENDRAAVSRFIESAYWGCMSQCHYSNVGPGLITSTPVRKANNQFNFTGYVVFPPPQSVAPKPVCKTCGRQILFIFVLEYIISFVFTSGSRIWSDCGRSLSVEGTTFCKISNNLSFLPAMPANLQNMPCGYALSLHRRNRSKHVLGFVQ